MRKVIVSTQMTLDGVIDPIEWFEPGDEDEEASYDQLFAAEAMLLGRKTYEGLAGVWPGMSDPHGYADRVNGMPKFVASTTLRGPLEWNATLIDGDVAAQVAKLKREGGGNLLSFGCGELAAYLAEHGLVDELWFWVHPVVWGSGVRPFHGRTPVRLQPTRTTTFASGVTMLSYRPNLAP
jgi:dihydrofolate reductase